MYVKYYRARKSFFVLTDDRTVSKTFPLLGSECVWIVPGTVGVDD